MAWKAVITVSLQGGPHGLCQCELQFCPLQRGSMAEVTTSAGSQQLDLRPYTHRLLLQGHSTGFVLLSLQKQFFQLSNVPTPSFRPGGLAEKLRGTL